MHSMPTETQCWEDNNETLNRGNPEVHSTICAPLRIGTVLEMHLTTHATGAGDEILH